MLVAFTPFTVILFLLMLAVSVMIGMHTNWIIGTILGFGAYYIIYRWLLTHMGFELCDAYYNKYVVPFVEKLQQLHEEDLAREKLMAELTEKFKEIKKNKEDEQPK